jgi:hypothetical protein
MSIFQSGWNAGDNDRRLGHLPSECARCPREYVGPIADQWNCGYQAGYNPAAKVCPPSVWPLIAHRFEVSAV